MELPKLKKINTIQDTRPLVVVMSPFTTRSGYGEHSKDIIKALIKSDKYNIKLVPIGWGATPHTGLEENELYLKDYILNTNLETQPDIFIHITIPNEFQRMGKYNIGITAGIETTIARPEWIEGLNRMDKVIVPSEFTKNVLMESKYQNRQNGVVISSIEPRDIIDVLFEGTDEDIYYKINSKEYNNIKDSKLKNTLDDINESFLYLVVGHWLNGDLYEDRKNISGSIKLFLDVFKQTKYKKNKPALLLKVSGGVTSLRDREAIIKKIDMIKTVVELNKGEVLPNIYLLHGELTNNEMNDLYNHPKVKCMLSLTKGEGYGRPLQEFAFIGKPIIVSNWSAVTDFIKPEHHTLINGELTQIHPSALTPFVIPESKWFTANFQQAGNSLENVFNNYGYYVENSNKGLEYFKSEKTLELMKDKLIDIIESKDKLQLPTLNLPKLKLANI
jgi:glycosyltransferase involved in cell wall biosynthesis